MSVVVITTDQQAEIDALVAEQRRHYTSWTLLQRSIIINDKPTLSLAERNAVPMPQRHEPRHIVLGNVTAAFSFEEQPAGICRHLSISVEQKGKLPHPAAIAMIAEAFGFTAFPPAAGKVWVEEYEPDRHAINIVEVAEPATPQVLQ
jgi:hypothetical protein